MALYYTLQHVWAVQISHHQVDVGYTKGTIQGVMPLCTLV